MADTGVCITSDNVVHTLERVRIYHTLHEGVQCGNVSNLGRDDTDRPLDICFLNEV
jgi:hypothetical protein